MANEVRKCKSWVDFSFLFFLVPYQKKFLLQTPVWFISYLSCTSYFLHLPEDGFYPEWEYVKEKSATNLCERERKEPHEKKRKTKRESTDISLGFLCLSEVFQLLQGALFVHPQFSLRWGVFLFLLSHQIKVLAFPEYLSHYGILQLIHWIFPSSCTNFFHWLCLPIFWCYLFGRPNKFYYVV